MKITPRPIPDITPLCCIHVDHMCYECEEGGGEGEEGGGEGKERRDMQDYCTMHREVCVCVCVCVCVRVTYGHAPPALTGCPAAP